MPAPAARLEAEENARREAAAAAAAAAAKAAEEAAAKAAEEAAAKAAEEAAKKEKCLAGGVPYATDHQWVLYRGTRGSGKICNNCYETRSNDNTPTWWMATRDEWLRVNNGGCPAGGGHEWLPHNPRAGYNPPWGCQKCGMVQDAERNVKLLPNCNGQWGPPVA